MAECAKYPTDTDDYLECALPGYKLTKDLKTENEILDAIKNNTLFGRAFKKRFLLKRTLSLLRCVQVSFFANLLPHRLK